MEERCRAKKSGLAESVSQNACVVNFTEDTDADNKRSEFSIDSEHNEEQDVTSFLLNKYIPSTTRTKELSTSDLLRTETCTLCGVTGPAIDFQGASVEPQHNIVLLSFLLMQNLVDIGPAVAFYNSVNCTHAMVCKGHYIKADLLTNRVQDVPC
ncbi:hypothetical protein ANCCAN_14801 [Ancylostoma caninum]|uniref:Uncharacterized protein n=1 Tax=Ancylostoma caninum TaxID=29170 RepID=A0A368G4A4_ANCCA|nr:hypothetical protein ANCCAN_14801 [Ancylostoma caninum]